MQKAAASKAETIRRLQLGNLISLCKHRCGYELPDDDAGREAHQDMLVLTSLAWTPRRR